jgi:hypothetical protein
MRIDVRAPTTTPAEPPPEQQSTAHRVMRVAMPLAYIVPGLLWQFGPTRDYAAASETIPLVGAAISCYLIGKGTPGYIACLLMAT